ncbi:unnamed protein product [Symbiodinium sp. CCMP2592]|nr:unnamed protein product [Symbiodinium sp. CCMP2592]
MATGFPAMMAVPGAVPMSPSGTPVTPMTPVTFSPRQLLQHAVQGVHTPTAPGPRLAGVYRQGQVLPTPASFQQVPLGWPAGIVPAGAGTKVVVSPTQACASPGRILYGWPRRRQLPSRQAQISGDSDFRVFEDGILDKWGVIVYFVACGMIGSSTDAVHWALLADVVLQGRYLIPADVALTLSRAIRYAVLPTGAAVVFQTTSAHDAVADDCAHPAVSASLPTGFTDALTERLADGGRHLVGSGCPGHRVFEQATAGAPFGWPFDQRMLSRNLEACPCGGAEGNDPCLGQLFCALSLTQSVGGLPRSIAQGNVDTHVITIDGQQDLENVSYAVENGRMKASAVRPLSTGDGTDLELVPDSLYYLIMTVGSTKCGVNQYVSYHNPSALQTHVCLMTLSATFECKPAADWPDTPPALSTTGSSTSTSTSSSFTVTSSSGTKTAISTTTSTTAWEWEGGPSLSLSNGVQEAKPCMLALTGIFLFFEQCL